MEAIKLKAHVGEDARLEWLEPLPKLPEGEIEVILLYENPVPTVQEQLSPHEWPVLDGGKFLGGSLRREDIYDDNGR